MTMNTRPVDPTLLIAGFRGAFYWDGQPFGAVSSWEIQENYSNSDTQPVGVIAPIDPHVETPEEVRDRILEAAEYIPLENLGTTDDCGFAPFSDDTSTSRDTAFAKIRRHYHKVELVSGALLVVIGLLIFTNRFTVIAQWLSPYLPVY